MTCTLTKAHRTQQCILVLAADRLACLPIAPSENAIGKLAAGLAMAAVRVYRVRGGAAVDASELKTAEDLDAAIDASGGFYLDEEWKYRTRLPVVGTMMGRAGVVIATRETVPEAMFAKLTLDRSAPSTKALKITSAIGGVIIAAAVIVYLATGSLEALFGIGFWGVLIIGAGVFAWTRLRAMSRG